MSDHQDGEGRRTLLDGVNLPAVADLRAAFGLVDEAHTQRAAAEAQEAQALQLVQDTLVTLALQIGDDEALRATVLQQLYWLEPEIRVPWLADAFGLGTHQVSQVAGRAKLPLTCARCGAEYWVIVTSRAQVREQEPSPRAPSTRRGGGRAVCDNCWNAVDRERSARAARERAAAEERLWQLRTMSYREYLDDGSWAARVLDRGAASGVRPAS